jgi:mannosyl-3-phosphoglycerate phosphatase
MPSPLYQRIILADVDGTLIDGRGRPFGLWSYVRQALSDSLIVLVSSRTVHEVVLAQHVLDVSGPFVAENGAVIAVPAEWGEASPDTVARVSGREFSITPIGVTRHELLGVLRGAASATDLAVEVESAVPGELAALVRSARGRVVVHRDHSPRTHSLRLTIDCAETKRQQLLTTLEGASLTVVSGGRWDVLQGRSHKGLGSRVLLRQIARPSDCPVVAIGDSENDLPMLEVADHRIVMRHADGSVHPALAGVPGVFVPATAGLAGWADILPHLHAQTGGDVAYA